MLSCDRIESAKFIQGTPSPAKLVYYSNLYSPKLQHYFSLTIRLFNVTSRTLVEGGCVSSQLKCSPFILQPQITGLRILVQFPSPCVSLAFWWCMEVLLCERVNENPASRNDKASALPLELIPRLPTTFKNAKILNCLQSNSQRNQWKVKNHKFEKYTFPQIYNIHQLIHQLPWKILAAQIFNCLQSNSQRNEWK